MRLNPSRAEFNPREDPLTAALDVPRICADSATAEYTRFHDAYVKHDDGRLDFIRGGAKKPYSYASGAWTDVVGDEKNWKTGRFWSWSNAETSPSPIVGAPLRAERAVNFSALHRAISACPASSISAQSGYAELVAVRPNWFDARSLRVASAHGAAQRT